MATLVVVGTQWGDEGKGKVVHLLSQKADYIVRYQGGNNAGHTVVFDNREFILHIIPAGILEPEKKCIIANGVVVDPVSLAEEIQFLEYKGIEVKNRLIISDACHIILPYHKILDELRERRVGNRKIGTTKKGIGPAYADKVARTGIRMADYTQEEIFMDLLDSNLKEKAPFIRKMVEPSVLRKRIVAQRRKILPELNGYIRETTQIIERIVREKKNVIFESAQGTLLDVDFGTYPYVTSSNPVAGGACAGAGIGPTRIDRVLGICKVYTTRVGEGPFPSEVGGEIADYLREKARNTAQPPAGPGGAAGLTRWSCGTV